MIIFCFFYVYYRILIALDEKPRTKLRRYVISSLFLRESFNFLTKNNDIESLHIATGVEFNGIKSDWFIITKPVFIDLDVQTAVRAKTNCPSLIKALINLAQYKHKFLACIHIHPGMGKEVTHPSYVDIELQKLLEKGKYPVVYGIFSRDGYLRFYGPGKFEIEIYGEGVEKKDEKLFQLTIQA